MTKSKTELMQVIVQKQDDYIKHFKSAYYHNGIIFKFGNFFFTRKVKKLEKELSDLKKQLEECEEDKYCICSYPRPHTYGGGTKQLCITCNKWINTKINE